MVSTFERGGMVLPPKCRLHFSQGSQATPSQYLNSAMSNCRLGSQSGLSSQDVAPLPSQACSQDYLLG